MKDIFELDIGEKQQISGLDDMFEPLFMTRVPGGWIAERYENNKLLYGLFIPYVKENEKAINEIKEDIEADDMEL